MSEQFLTPHVREQLGIAADAALAPDTDLTQELHIDRERILSLVDGAFPMLMHIDNSDAAKRREIFVYGMEHTPPADSRCPHDFGRPWTVQRLSTLFAVLADRSMPDNGSD